MELDAFGHPIAGPEGLEQPEKPKGTPPAERAQPAEPGFGSTLMAGGAQSFWLFVGLLALGIPVGIGAALVDPGLLFYGMAVPLFVVLLTLGIRRNRSK